LLDKHGLYEKYLKKVDKPAGVTKNSLKTRREILEQMTLFSELPQLIINQRTLNNWIKLGGDILSESDNESGFASRYKYFPQPAKMRHTSLSTINIRNDEPGLNRAFVAKNGYVLISANYSSLEFHMLATLSQEQYLIDAFSRTDDPFEQIASRVYLKEMDDVTHYQTYSIRQVCFK